MILGQLRMGACQTKNAPLHQGQVSDRLKRGEAERFLEFCPSAPPHQPEVATLVTLNLTMNIRSMV